MKAQRRNLPKDDRDISASTQASLEAIRRVSRIAQDLTSIHDREQLLERAVLCLIHDLSYKGAFVTAKVCRGLKEPPGSKNKSVRTRDQMRVLVPIQFDHEVLGTIVIPFTTGRRITDANREILDIFAEFLGISLNNVRRIEEVRELAFVDSLTGVMNRRYLLEILPREIAKTKSMAMIAVDIDLFKAINDTYGHLAGDTVLRFVADRAKKCLRKTDLLVRYGGDEFVILLPHTRLESARHIAERIRRNIESSAVKLKEDSVYCTISIGIACFVPGVDPISLMNHADQALYAAKHSGRNLVCSAQPD
jgi:diguanylate cyclase (GGDEF)-like protein